MLATEFFPTPVEVIEKMLAPMFIERRNPRYDHTYNVFRHKGTILEPSAGSGAILDYLKDKLEVKQRDLFAVEVDYDLRMTLQGKGYKLVGTDWLQYDEPMTWGMIIMNPPFSNGCEHVLKAWEHLDDEGDLIALLNAETVRNLCTKNREVLKALIEKHGNVEFFGSCFKDSERPTDVEVACIWLKKPKSNFSINFDDMQFQMDAEVDPEKFQANPLAHTNVLEDLVARYNAARKVLIERFEMQSKLDFYLNGIASPVYDETRHHSDRDKDALALHCNVKLNDQLAVLKSRFWQTVFTKTKLGTKTTSKFRDKFEKFAITQSSLSFTVQNVTDMLEMFFLNSDQIMKDCLMEVFDELTKYFENTDQWKEGWKTNKGWVVNKKVIIPYGVNCDQWGWWSTNYRIQKFLDDLDKVLCFLSGKKFEEINSAYRTLDDRCRSIRSQSLDYSEKFQSEFFEMKMFKKGTLHLEFKDLELLKKFNKQAAEGKNWIGGGGF